MRGCLSLTVSQKASELLGCDITTTELRLMPYVQYVMVNDQMIDPNKVNPEERKILQKWRRRGWISGGVSGLAMSKEFWDAIHEILWISYVTRDYQEE